MLKTKADILGGTVPSPSNSHFHKKNTRTQMTKPVNCPNKSQQMFF